MRPIGVLKASLETKPFFIHYIIYISKDSKLVVEIRIYLETKIGLIVNIIPYH